MGEQPRRDIVRNEGGGFFKDLTLRIKLILRLMGDRRVNPLLKILPLGAVVYLFVPDLVIGPLDDAAVIWLGSYLFVELCPPAVVSEHMRALTSVVDAEWRELDDDGGDGKP
jgi:hypothetical protein